MRSLINHLDCGYLNEDPKRSLTYFTHTKFNEITDKIIPFFTNNPLQGAKLSDFDNFCKVAELMIPKTLRVLNTGLEQIREIKSRMNRNKNIVP
jgi:hypothetical protein